MLVTHNRFVLREHLVGTKVNIKTGEYSTGSWFREPGSGGEVLKAKNPRKLGYVR